MIKNDDNDDDNYDNGPQFVQANIQRKYMFKFSSCFYWIDLEATDLYQHDMKYTNTVKNHTRSTWEQVCQKCVKSNKAKAVQ